MTLQEQIETIKTDNMQTLYNALDRIKELEFQNNKQSEMLKVAKERLYVTHDNLIDFLQKNKADKNWGLFNAEFVRIHKALATIEEMEK